MGFSRSAHGTHSRQLFTLHLTLHFPDFSNLLCFPRDWPTARCTLPPLANPPLARRTTCFAVTHTKLRQMNLNAKFGKTPKIQANATVKLTLLPTWTLRLFSAFSARLRVKSARRHWRRRFSSVFPTFRRLFLCNANIPGGITSLADSATLFPWTSSRTFWRS